MCAKGLIVFLGLCLNFIYLFWTAYVQLHKNNELSWYLNTAFPIYVTILSVGRFVSIVSQVLFLIIFWQACAIQNAPQIKNYN